MTMTIEEAKAMAGTEFTFNLISGSTIPCYVKMFDEKIGLSCFSLTTHASNGWRPAPSKTTVEDDGTFCVISYRTIPKALEVLEEIRDTGEYGPKMYQMRGLGISCPFK